MLAVSPGRGREPRKDCEWMYVTSVLTFGVITRTEGHMNALWESELTEEKLVSLSETRQSKVLASNSYLLVGI